MLYHAVCGNNSVGTHGYVSDDVAHSGARKDDQNYIVKLPDHKYFDRPFCFG